MCSYLEWQLNIEPQIMKDFEERVRRDFKGNGPYPAYSLSSPAPSPMPSTTPYPSVLHEIGVLISPEINTFDARATAVAGDAASAVTQYQRVWPEDDTAFMAALFLGPTHDPRCAGQYGRPAITGPPSARQRVGSHTLHMRALIPSMRFFSDYFPWYIQVEISNPTGTTMYDIFRAVWILMQTQISYEDSYSCEMDEWVCAQVGGRRSVSLPVSTSIKVNKQISRYAYGG
ncbi:hypothetical protein EUX98_g9531 [Antrodiella citrinella]|uniref:DUF6699 domain-containing protein n=1 Tax=Antrodiella citrinella TaxID=2447956 RepID=A0A4V3XEU5_9APHY|nr:hypothetical protein EUX98_g9531 [Antrodiella citrinella]